MTRWRTSRRSRPQPFYLPTLKQGSQQEKQHMNASHQATGIGCQKKTRHTHKEARDSHPMQVSLGTHLTPVLWSEESHGNLQATFSPSMNLQIPAKPIRKVSTFLLPVQPLILNFSSPQDPTCLSAGQAVLEIWGPCSS